MSFVLLLLLISSAFAMPCGPHEIYVREQWINAYTKQDGTKVSAHSRKPHCRELKRLNYFQDSSKQTFKNIKTNIKKWSSEEKKIVEEYLEKLPAWLKKYKLTEILRGDIGGNALNPAAAFLSQKHYLFLIISLNPLINKTSSFMKSLISQFMTLTPRLLQHLRELQDGLEMMMEREHLLLNSSLTILLIPSVRISQIMWKLTTPPERSCSHLTLCHF